MKSTLLSLVVLVTTLSSPFAHALNYKALPWKELGTAKLVKTKLATFEVKNEKGKFLRMEFSQKCGYLGYGVEAEALPFNPAMVFERNQVDHTPFSTIHYFFVKEERTFEFKKIYFTYPTTNCDMKISIADTKDVVCGKGPKVFAEGHAYSDVAAHIAQNLAWDRTLQNAQGQCQSPWVCKLPGESKCSWAAAGHHFNAQCNGWFVCE